MGIDLKWWRGYFEAGVASLCCIKADHYWEQSFAVSLLKRKDRNLQSSSNIGIGDTATFELSNELPVTFGPVR